MDMNLSICLSVLIHSTLQLKQLFLKYQRESFMNFYLKILKRDILMIKILI